MRANKSAFTLVEIMIVVGIIITLAALAIPNLFRSRLNASEAAAIQSLKTISVACENYRAAQTPTTYALNLAAMALPISNPAYIDNALSTGTKQGYNFVYNFQNTNQYICDALPVQPGLTGTRSFRVDETGVIRDVTAGLPGLPIG